jgi:hypothetical protein
LKDYFWSCEDYPSRSRLRKISIKISISIRRGNVYPEVRRTIKTLSKAIGPDPIWQPPCSFGRHQDRKDASVKKLSMLFRGVTQQELLVRLDGVY